jgi:hypothetical protein
MIDLTDLSKKFKFPQTFLCAFPAAQPCPVSFAWVEGVGCVVVVEKEVRYEVALTSCPGGSQLVSLYHDNLRKLSDYVRIVSVLPSEQLWHYNSREYVPY